jgi:hypothetical protein
MLHELLYHYRRIKIKFIMIIIQIQLSDYIIYQLNEELFFLTHNLHLNIIM